MRSLSLAWPVLPGLASRWRQVASRDYLAPPPPPPPPLVGRRPPPPVMDSHQERKLIEMEDGEGLEGCLEDA